MNLTIRIADIVVTLDVSACDPAVAKSFAQYYAAFTIPPEPPAVLVRLRSEPGPDYIPVNLASTWVVRTTHQDGYISFESYKEKGWADLRIGQGELILREHGDPENYLRVLYAWLCLQHNSLLIHASGVVRDQRGYVFFGASGSGKTTITRLSDDGATLILSDDLVIVKKRGETFWACGVPFRGEMMEAPRTNADAPLVGLFTLVKASAHRIEPVPTAEAVGRLAACIPFVMAQAANAARVVQVSQDLVAHVPMQRLYFRKDAGLWEVIRGVESNSIRK